VAALFFLFAHALCHAIGDAFGLAQKTTKTHKSHDFSDAFGHAKLPLRLLYDILSPIFSERDQKLLMPLRLLSTGLGLHSIG
jgi:hypothetical protein